jgi:acetylornithine deacetylase/succinyl-diaminopimelate desuccinylase family protein
MAETFRIPTPQSISSSVYGWEDELARWLSQLVKFDTSNPPGREAEAQEWLAEEFSQLGMSVDRWDVYPGRPNVVATWKGTGGGRSLILNGHVDVAEATQVENWLHPPFSGAIEQRRVFGRGASDMKSGIAGFFFALKALKRTDYKPAGDVIVECVMGEEKSEPGTRACIDRGYRADFAVVGEDSGLQVFPNIGSMVGCVEVRSPDSLHVNRRIYYQHAGGQLNAANMLEKAALKVLPALNDLERHWANQRRHPLFPAGQEMIAPFLLTGGGNPYITPNVARLYFQVSYLPGHPKDEVRREVEDEIDRAAQADPWLREHPPRIEWQPPDFPTESVPADIDLDSAAIRLLRQCHSSALDADLKIGGLGFASDAGWLSAAGIPAVSYGPGDPALAHSVDESVSVEAVLDYARVIALFTASWTSSAAISVT